MEKKKKKCPARLVEFQFKKGHKGNTKKKKKK